MAGLVPAIHALLAARPQDVGAGNKCGHDSEGAARPPINARLRRRYISGPGRFKYCVVMALADQ
jgi:hypothetical protein